MSENRDSGLADPPDAEIFLSQDAVTRIAAASMPLTLQGTNKARVAAPVIGVSEVEASWTAIISNPRITIEKDAASFDADAAVSIGSLNYKHKVHGQLDMIFDKKKNQIVVKTNNVAMNLNLKQEGRGAAVKVDISDEMPQIEFRVGLPTSVLKLGKKTVRVELSPKVEYLEGRVRISSPLKIVAPKTSSQTD